MHRTRITCTNGSISIEIPDDLAKDLGLSEGDAIDIEGSPDNAALVIWLTAGRDEDAGAVDQDRAQRIEEIIERRRAMLESLAQR